jgi:YVTN family beta-propeller protein
MTPQFRRPAALAIAADGRWLFTANRRNGTVSVLDTETARCVGEVEVGRGLADLALTPDGRRLIAADEVGNAVYVLARDGPRLRAVRRVPVGGGPVCVRVAADGSRFFVARLWAHHVSVVDLAGERPPRGIDLPFPPRLLLPAGDRLIVSDAFGGRLAVVDAATGTISSVHALPGHNIRGLCLSPDGRDLLMTHQTLDGRCPTTVENVFWGNLMANNLRSMPLAELLAPGGDPVGRGRLAFLGEVGRGAADPSGIAVAADGTAVLGLAGTGEVAVGRPDDADLTRLPVGRRPTAVVLAPDGRRAFVANTLSDSVTVIDLPGRKLRAEIRLGPTSEPWPADRGEQLFHNARLSKDGWMSCHSCHPDGHSNGRLCDTLGDGSYGTPKRVLSLLGTRDTGPWAWDGSQPSLESQILKTVRTTMRGPEPTDAQVRDLAAFVRTLEPPPSEAPTASAESVRRGGEVFHDRGCAKCHTPPGYTSPKRYDVGLTDEANATEFNPPSLRGVAHGGPFLHDGRAATLADVFSRYRHRLDRDLSASDLVDLLAFLRSL